MNIEIEIQNLIESNKLKSLSLGQNKKYKRIYDWLKLKTSFLSVDSKINQRVYHYYHTLNCIPICLECGKELKFRDFKKGYGEFCSRVCQGKSDIVKARREDTNVNKYGVKNCFQSEDKKSKIKETCIKKYGYNHYQSTDDYKEKYKKTSFERYGVDNPNKNEKIKEKVKKSWESVDKELANKKRKDYYIKNYGVEHNMQIESVKEKRVNTYKERYGADSPAKNPEIFNKMMESQFRWKSFEFPSGRMEKIQGYEPQALKVLLTKYDESDIVVSNLEIKKLIGEIKYEFKGSLHSYFPDVFVKSHNKIYEIKSSWTYESDKEKNDAKRMACLAAGLDFEFLILTENGEILNG